MKPSSIEDKLKPQGLFWKKKNPKALIGFYVGDEYFGPDFAAAAPLYDSRGPLRPSMIDIPTFMKDYERLYQRYERVSGDTLWSASPVPSFPWIPAFIGCQIYGKGNAFWEESVPISLKAIREIELSPRNAWLMKFTEMVRTLISRSHGRYALGHPMFRGPIDLLGTLRGQKQMVYDLIDDPVMVKEVADHLGSLCISVLKNWYELIPSFRGGHSLAVYDLWAPGKCLRLQEDILALLSPSLYEKIFLDVDSRIANAVPYSLVHLHPSCLAFLDYFLDLPKLNVIELCKDPSPSIQELVPTFKRIQKKKPLMFFGRLTREEVGQMLSSLEPEGLYVRIMVSSLEEAEQMRSYIKREFGSLVLCSS